MRRRGRRYSRSALRPRNGSGAALGHLLGRIHFPYHEFASDFKQGAGGYVVEAADFADGGTVIVGDPAEVVAGLYRIHEGFLYFADVFEYRTGEREYRTFERIVLKIEQTAGIERFTAETGFEMQMVPGRPSGASAKPDDVPRFQLLIVFHHGRREVRVECFESETVPYHDYFSVTILVIGDNPDNSVERAMNGIPIIDFYIGAEMPELPAHAEG